MGEVLRKLADTTLPRRDDHNKRLFVDLSESVHIHFREHRLVFGVAEFQHFARVIAEGASRLQEEVAKGYRSKSDAECRANVQVPTMIIGGSQTEAIPVAHPEQSKYFDERLVIEQQTPAVKDKFHVHYRDLRIVFNNDDTFLKVCDTFARAGAAYRATLPIAGVTPRWEKDGVGPLEHVDVGIPILVDRDGVIIDGHHRYYLALERGDTSIAAIRLDLTFGESQPIRAFELKLKEERRWELLGLYKRAMATLCSSRSERLGCQSDQVAA